MKEYHSTVRLHLWLESGEDVFFGTGRAMLLAGIEKYGSLKKAAEEMGISYRSAWGKIRKSEQVLGVELVTKSKNRRDGYELTDFGRLLKERFTQWFSQVEEDAVKKAIDIFSMDIRRYAANGKVVMEGATELGE